MKLEARLIKKFKKVRILSIFIRNSKVFVRVVFDGGWMGDFKLEPEAFNKAEKEDGYVYVRGDHIEFRTKAKEFEEFRKLYFKAVGL